MDVHTGYLFVACSLVVLHGAVTSSSPNSIEHSSDLKTSIQVTNSCDCQSSNSTCSCCQLVSVNDVTVMACANVRSTTSQKVLKFTFLWDGKLFINDTYSAESPQEFCCEPDAPHHPVYSCLLFYNVSFSDPARVTGCLMLSVHINTEFIIPMTCFNVSRLNQVPAEGRRNFDVPNDGDEDSKNRQTNTRKKFVTRNKPHKVSRVVNRSHIPPYEMEKVALRSGYCTCKQYKPISCHCCVVEGGKQRKAACIRVQRFSSKLVMIRITDHRLSVNGSRGLGRVFLIPWSKPINVHYPFGGEFMLSGPSVTQQPNVIQDFNVILAACSKMKVRKPHKYNKHRSDCVYIRAESPLTMPRYTIDSTK